MRDGAPQPGESGDSWMKPIPIGMIVNKRTYNFLKKLSVKANNNSNNNFLLVIPWNGIPVYCKSYLRYTKVCYTQEQIKEALR